MDYIFLTKAYTESNDTSSTDERYTFGNNILNKQYFEFFQKLHSILRLKIKLILNILISNYIVIHAETLIMVKDSKIQSSNACEKCYLFYCMQLVYLASFKNQIK